MLFEALWRGSGQHTRQGIAAGRLFWLYQNNLHFGLFLLALEFLRTEKLSTSGSYFLCEVHPVRFHLLGKLWQLSDELSRRRFPGFNT